ncbi:hypothetical protein SAMN05216420_101130 [Nitrosospira sp. Nl5]|nr:hypothetical protein SAMN05216420_101130 [Nitrosospira sp. Nl5]
MTPIRGMHQSSVCRGKDVSTIKIKILFRGHYWSDG